jgi:ParB-like chromosome segregation protein Spo0J
MSKTAFEGLSRYSGFQGDPSEFVIAGIDTDDRFPECPLVDTESNSSPVDEGLVAAMMVQGFIGSVVVTKMGGLPMVVDGRRSVRAAREASRRLVEAGRSPLVVHADKVDAAVGVGRDLDLYGMVVSRNEHRREKTPLERAKQCQQMTRYGADVARCAALLGVTPAAVRGWLDLTTLSPQVQEAVASKKTSAAAARKLKNLPEKDQNAVVEKMLSESTKATSDAFARAAREKSGGEKSKGAPPAPKPGKKELKATMARYLVSDDFRRGVLWALGELTNDEALSSFLDAPPPAAVALAKRGRPRKVVTETLAGFGDSDIPE